MQQRIHNFLDFFYPPFRKIMPVQTFRYAACGGANTVLGLGIYYVLLTYVFREQNVDAGFIVLKPHNAALFISFCINFVVGFILNKYLVFIESNLRGHIQLFRYLLSFLVNLVINYFLLKFFVEYLHWDAFISQVITTCIVIVISYLSQRHFTFRKKRQVDS